MVRKHSFLCALRRWLQWSGVLQRLVREYSILYPCRDSMPRVVRGERYGREKGESMQRLVRGYSFL
jgi:hypothetical protein